MVEFGTARLVVHVFQLHEEGPASEELDASCDMSAANHWMLPNGPHTLTHSHTHIYSYTHILIHTCMLLWLMLPVSQPAEFHGMWENLVYDVEIKEKVYTVCSLTLYMYIYNCTSLNVQLLNYAESTLVFSDR